jgi:ribose/xylose/arabinose/galactoside ABC-type transport system permease subunit
LAKNAILNSLRAAGQFVQKLNIPGIAVGDLLLILFFSLMSDRFLSSYNLLAILRNSCTLLLAALGLTWVILMSQNNVSVGAVVSMAAVMVPILNNKGLPIVVVLIAPLLMGMLVGYINGLLIAKMKFDFWVVTFGTMSLMAGLALVAAGGETVSTQAKFSTISATAG